MVRFPVSLCVGVAAVALIASAPPASAGIPDLVGGWINADHAARDLAQLTIHMEGGQLMVHAWGACRPNDCDWGEVPAHVFTPNVSIPVDVGANAAIAEFDQHGISTMVLLQTNAGELQYKVFMILPDGSTRSDYHVSGHLLRR